MRKTLILTVTFMGIGGLVAAAQGSQDRVPERDNSQVTTRTESFQKDGGLLGAPRDERFQEARERYSEEHSEEHEHEEDDDRD